MPDVVLNCGQSVYVDDEDYEFVVSTPWFVRRRADRSIRIARDEYAGSRVFRIFLHRAIALRMRPELKPYVAELSVKARNGDYTDVRRVNLEVALKKNRSGSPTSKPTGTYRRGPKRNITHGTIAQSDIPTHTSPLWSGGVVRTRTAKYAGGQRRYVTLYSRRIVVEHDGRGGPEVCGGDVGSLDAQGWCGREPARGDEVLLRGEDEGR